MMNDALKLLTFNIQHLNSSVSKATKFLLLIASKSPDILGITEFDTSDENIYTIFQNAGYTPITTQQTHTPRSQIFVKTSNFHKIQKTNQLQQRFPYPYNKYISDIIYTEGPTTYHIISIYAPVYRSIPSSNHICYVTNQDFHTHLQNAITQTALSNPIFMGDWNTPPHSNTDNVMARISNIDATTFVKGKHKKLPTNTHPTTSQRIDRFYVPAELFAGYTCKYTTLPKQTFSTHNPIMLSFKKWTPRRGRIWHEDNYNPQLYIQRKQPIDLINIEKYNAIDTIFKPTTIWENDALLSLDYYTETIYTRYKKWRRMYISNNPPPTDTDTKYNRLKEAHSGNTLSSTYKELNLRFTKKLDQTTFSDESMEKTHALFTKIFDNPDVQSQQPIEQLFTQEYAPLINNKLTEEEIEHLKQPFTTAEIYSNLKRLHHKGPSSPGPDGITYSAWYKGWEHAKTHLTIAANCILQENIPETSSLFNTLIKLIPKKEYDPNHPNPSHIRPISLTNCSFRLINYSITRRSMGIFNRIIAKHQQAFLNGRDMNYHIQTAKILAHELQTHCNNNKRSALLLDITKAFDTISHQFIPTIMKHYHFPPQFIKNIISQNQQGTVHLLNNRYLYKKKIELRCGVRQGLPISPLIFNLCLEPLLHRLQHELTGITYNPLHIPITHPNFNALTHNVKLQAFADDIITFNNDVQDLNTTQNACKLYAQISGLHMNPRKTIIYTHENAISIIKTTFPSEIKVTTWNDNPKYLGINLINIDWKTKLEELYNRTRRILFLDLPLHKIILGINTYIFSTIYFYDQHEPIPTQHLNTFMQQIKQLLTKAPYPKLPQSCALWHIPRSQGGFGLIDLPKQLIGRQAHFIMYSLLNETTSSNHPHFPTLIRIQLQIYATQNNQLHTSQNIIMQAINESIQNNQQTFNSSHQLQTLLKNQGENYENIQSWISLLHTSPTDTKQDLQHITITKQKPNFHINYSQLFRNHYRHQHAMHIRMQEETYLRNNQIPPPLGPTFPPITLQLPTDQKLNIRLPRQIKIYPPLLQYLTAWYTIFEPVLHNIKIIHTTPDQLHTLIHKPTSHNEFHILSTLQTKKPFCSKNLSKDPTIGLEALRHLSKTYHDNQQYIENSSKTWISDTHIQNDHTQWQRFFKKIGPLLISSNEPLYYLSALNTGLLNSTFYRPCSFCHRDTTPLSPIKHLINCCPIATKLYNYYTKQPQPTNLQFLICPQQPDQYARYSKFIGFLTYCGRYSYAQTKDTPQHQITWNTAEMETISLKYSNR